MAPELKTLAAFILALLATRPAFGQAAAACVLPPNAVARENCLLGRQADFWEGDAREGALSLSSAGASAGETLRFTAAVKSRGARLEIYRLGYYAGFGARLISRLEAPDVDGPLDFEWRVPADALSGVYVARLEGRRRKEESRAAFVVREEGRRRDVLVVVGGDGCKPALACVLSREQPLVRWLERNGFDAAYVAAEDLAARPALLRGARLIVTAADDSLWAPELAAAVAGAREAGAHLAYLGAPGSAEPPAPDGYELPLTLDAAAASFERPSGETGGLFRSKAARWVWGLDNRHAGGTRAARREVRQATLDAFADLGTSAGALEPGLRPASASR